MKLVDYDALRDDMVTYEQGISDAKRPGYTQGDIDVLQNFKSIAKRLGISPMQVWGVYSLKHLDAIMSYAKDPNLPQAEDLKGRFADARNYLMLGYALLTETKGS